MMGIICAMQLEAEGIIAEMQNIHTIEIAKMKFTTGVLCDKNAVVVVCGVGKVNAAACAAVLIERFKPDEIINSGVAGAVSPLVTVGDLVIGEKAVEHDMNTTAVGDKQGEVSFAGGVKMFFECDGEVSRRLNSACADVAADDGKIKAVSGTVASGDIFVSDRKQRTKIGERFGALACEMEGAAIGHVCHMFGVPYGIVRAISDDLDENKGEDFVKFSRTAAAHTVSVICKYFAD